MQSRHASLALDEGEKFSFSWWWQPELAAASRVSCSAQGAACLVPSQHLVLLSEIPFVLAAPICWLIRRSELARVMWGSVRRSHTSM